MIAREHVGRGWGDPVDPSRPDVWLAHGYICAYDPAHPGRAELWTTFGRTDNRYVTTNAEQARENARVAHARRPSKWLGEWLGINEIGSRFD